MFRVEVKEKIHQELTWGEAARQQGLEGKARVCARRAAGAAIRAFFEDRGLPTLGSSAYDLIADFQALPGITPDLRRAAERLLAQVDEDHRLPGDPDLLADARWLAVQLEALIGSSFSGGEVNE